ncbi:hypothetical protein JCM3765_002910 [Sporobolomyces pararoseus]
MSPRHTSNSSGDDAHSLASYPSIDTVVPATHQNPYLFDKWLHQPPPTTPTVSPLSRALIKNPSTLNATSVLTKTSTIKEIVDIVREGICKPLLTKGLSREDREGKGIRWLRVWSDAANHYLSTELRKISLPVGKTGDEFVFAATDFLKIEALLKKLVSDTSPHKLQSEPKLPYPQAFPLLGSFPQHELEWYQVSGKMSPVMALFALIQIKRLLYMALNTYRDVVSDTVAYAKHPIDPSYSELERAVLSQWERNETTVQIQRELLDESATLLQYLTEFEFREIETRQDRFARIIDENRKFSKWVRFSTP